MLPMSRILNLIEAILIAVFRIFMRPGQSEGRRRSTPGAVGHRIDIGDGYEPCAIDSQMLEKHLYILGATGTGKTNLVLKLLEADLLAERTCIVVDLRGDLVQRALALCRSAELRPERVTLLDLREKEYVVGFNPLVGQGEPFIRALHLVDVIRTESESWGVQLEETLRNGLLLLAHSGRHLTDLERVLLDPGFASTLAVQCPDPGVADFFNRYANLSEDRRLAWALPVLNKVTPLLATPGLRAILGSPSSIDLERLLKQRGRVVLIALAVDELHRSGKMLGSLLVAAISRTMFARVNDDERRRNPVRLYIDEFEAMASQSFESLVAEGRRFRLSLVLSHQNLSQLPNGLRSVIRNNVGLQALFACGLQDASGLSRELAGNPTKEDLTSLDPGQMYLFPRGQDPILVQTDLVRSDVSRQDLQAFRDEVLRNCGMKLADVQAAIAKANSPSNKPIKNYTLPWGFGGE